MARKTLETNLRKLAPCGINCETCYLHLSEINPCLGCREPNFAKAKRCQNCKIMDCVTTRAIRFCFECPNFPCDLIEQLDKEYRYKFEEI